MIILVVEQRNCSTSVKVDPPLLISSLREAVQRLSDQSEMILAARLEVEDDGKFAASNLLGCSLKKHPAWLILSTSGIIPQCGSSTI